MSCAETLAEKAGLKLDVIIVQVSMEDWDKLGEIYDAETTGHSIMPFSFYMILHNL